MAARRLVREHYSWKRSLAIILLGVALAVLVAWAAVQPLRPLLAARYLARGDAFLQSQEFGEAGSQYRTALFYEPNDTQASVNLALSKEGATDPQALREFYAAHNVQSQLSQLDQALRSFSSPKDALVAGAGLYATHDYAFAQYPLRKAVEMDPQYAEAWNYLALDYKELAKLNSAYAAKQKDAEDRRDSLTTQYLQK